MEMNKSFNTALLLLTLFTFGCASIGPVTNVSDPEFIALFEKERKHGPNERRHIDEVEKYVRNCCSSKQELIFLLEENGFSVSVKNRADDPEFFKEYALAFKLKPTDDVHISGTRQLETINIAASATYVLRVNYTNENITDFFAYIKRPPSL